MSRLLSKCSGITLIECLVYIVLLGIIMNLAGMGFYRSWQISRQSLMHLTNLTTAQIALGRVKEEIHRANAVLPSFQELKSADDTLLLQMNDEDVHAIHFDGRRLSRERFIEGKSAGKIDLGRFESVRFGVENRLVRMTVMPIKDKKPGKFRPVFDCAASLRSKSD